MKINTDGVLLGALASADEPKKILDIGTGTGVIALMLAQRFPKAQIDAVEIDQSAAATAGRNFSNSPFADRLQVYPLGFEEFFELNPDKEYDLIVSNPPFYINSLKSRQKERQLAKHTDADFLWKLVSLASDHLSEEGIFCMILPNDTADLVLTTAVNYDLYVHRVVDITSFPVGESTRVIVYLGFEWAATVIDSFCIYQSVGVYSEEYVNLLKPYFIAF